MDLVISLWGKYTKMRILVQEISESGYKQCFTDLRLKFSVEILLLTQNTRTSDLRQWTRVQVLSALRKRA
jgi:hypothetical protein